MSVEDRPTVLSLFSGLGGFDLAFEMVGYRTVGQCEIDPHALKVLRRHWPDVPKHEDVTTLSGADIPPVDVVTFGSPCQDLSTAGKRAGLAGDRSGLFLEAVRIIREMQEATDGRNPRFALWENVPGSLSSWGGADFGEVLARLVGGPIRTPTRWAAAGVAFGPQGSAEWRVLNTRHFGPPQQRRRVFVVYDPRGERAGQILLDAGRVRRRAQPGEEARSADPAHARGRPRGAGGAPVVSGVLTGQIANGADDNHARAGWLVPDTARTITTRDRQDASTETLIPVAFKIRGGVEIDSNGQRAGKGYLGSEDCALTLETSPSAQMLAEPIAFDRAAGGTHDLQAGPVAPTLQVSAGIGRAAVAFALRGREAGSVPEASGDVTGTLRSAAGGSSREFVALAFAENSRAEARLQGGDGQTTGALTTGGGKPGQGMPTVATAYGIRKLTPRETERLQGLPDDWTRYDEHGQEIADSHRYRMTGNAVTVPVVEAIAASMLESLRESPTIPTREPE